MIQLYKYYELEENTSQVVLYELHEKIKADCRTRNHCCHCSSIPYNTGSCTYE